MTPNPRPQDPTPTPTKSGTGGAVDAEPNSIPDVLQDNAEPDAYLKDVLGDNGEKPGDGIKDGLNFDMNDDDKPDYLQLAQHTEWSNIYGDGNVLPGSTPSKTSSTSTPNPQKTSAAIPDKDGDTIPDTQDPDNNGDGIVDSLSGLDKGDTQKPDYLEDLDHNNRMDGLEHDMNRNGVDDELDDKNSDGRLSAEELASATTKSGGGKVSSDFATATPTKSEGVGRLSSGAQAGIGVGSALFVILCAALGFLLFRRSKRSSTRWNGGGVEKTGYEEPVLPPADVGVEPVMPIWREPPKDDDAMMRMFKNLDGRITDHVLNFYVAGDSRTYQAELARMPRDVRKALELHVSRLDHLVATESSRIFALRALLTGMVLRTVTEGAFYMDTTGGKLTSNNPTAGDDGYQESRERTILRLSQIVHEQMHTFATPDANESVRLRSLEEVARAVAELATAMERQPHSWDLIWGGGDGSNFVVYDPTIMEIAKQVPREGAETSKIRAVVFPGMSKTVVQGQEVNTVVMAKMQVLSY